jgi:hypothetical protein
MGTNGKLRLKFALLEMNKRENSMLSEISRQGAGTFSKPIRPVLVQESVISNKTRWSLFAGEIEPKPDMRQSPTVFPRGLLIQSRRSSIPMIGITGVRSLSLRSEALAARGIRLSFVVAPPIHAKLGGSVDLKQHSPELFSCFLDIIHLPLEGFQPGKRSAIA